MAARSLSPDRVAQKLREHRSAVAVLARARGQKVAHFTAKEIAVLAEVELQRNRTRFIAEAEHTIATSPAFARWRLPNADVLQSAQKQTQPISTTSTLQISGAK